MYNLSENVFGFLNLIRKNNNREWFRDNKPQYESALENMIGFADALLEEIRKWDDIETVSGKKSLYRIYRDVRFSSDKNPYKSSWSGSFKRATRKRRGGYYYHLEPGNTFIAGGFFGPNPEDLKQIRRQIDQDDAPLRNILQNLKTIEYFGELSGDRVKTSPQGYSAQHPSIDLLRYKQFILKHSFSDSELKDSNFHQKMAEGFHAMLPFFDVMSDYLTTDLNGIPLE